MKLANFVKRSGPINWQVVTPHLMGRSVRESPCRMGNPVRCLTLVAVASLVGTSEVSAQDVSDEAQIRAVRAMSNQAIARHDLAGILGLLEDDYHVSTSTGAFLRSRAEMGEVFAAHFAEFENVLYVRTPESVEVSAASPVASEIGSWVGSWTTTEGPFRTGGRYVAYWRKVDGEWRVHAELYVPLFCEGPGCA